MKIIELRGENVKRMKAFALKPDGHTVIVAGKNGQGKSSLLDSIVLALGGKSTETAKLTKKPIRDGEKTAYVEVDLGEYTVTRKWTERNDSLEILGKNGEKFSSPQKMLDELIGDLSFDPLEFTRLSAKEQRAVLLELVDLGFDLDAWEKNYKEVYDKRTEIGRDVKRLQGAADSLEYGYSIDTPKEEIDVAALMKDLERYTKLTQAEDQKYQAIAQAEQKIIDNKDEIKRLEEHNKEIESLIKSTKKEIDDNPADYHKVTVIREQIDKSNEINAAVRARKAFEDTEQALIEAQKKYDKGTEYLKEQEQKKAKALKEAKMPVTGLGFDDDGVTFKDIPFSQLSQAEQIKVSMAIAMAQNPKLRIIRIDDGSLLDEDNLAAVQKMAEGNDFQVWVERVSDDAKMGVVIEDGEIVANYSESKSDES